MSHTGLFGSWHLAQGEAEERYGLGCLPWTETWISFSTRASQSLPQSRSGAA
jgi:hypothetical protein